MNPYWISQRQPRLKAAEVPAETAPEGDQEAVPRTEFSDAQPQLSTSGFIPMASSNHINHTNPIQIRVNHIPY